MKIRHIAALSLIFAIAAVGLAQTAAPARGAWIAKYLELTPDQIAAWKQIHADTAATLRPLAASQRDTRQQLEAALKAPSPDPAAVGKLAIALHATRGQIKAARDDQRAKLVATLTPEQKTKFEALEALKKRGRP
ncbi:MAG TPA: periplasmic heavy metal sensor [Thermoanaerobaculia bacterium]|nr:periplasmic heavy metal sensor [Thermoanaerobaculia bacterium]